MLPDPDSPTAPPHDFLLEQAVLGTLLLRNETLDIVRDGGLAGGHFTDPDHRALFDAIAERVERGEEAGVLSMKAWAEEGIKASGGAAHLAQLAAASIHVGDLRASVAILQRLRQRRAMLTAADGLRLAAFDESNLDTERVVQSLSGELDAALHTSSGGGFAPFATIVERATQQAEGAYRSGGRMIGLATGLPTLDWWLGGLAASDLVILAGRPSMGKTALATNIACNAASTSKVVGFASLEMASWQLAMRIVGAQAGVEPTALMRGSVNAAQFERMLTTSEAVAGLPLFIDQTGDLTVPQLRVRARQLKRQRGLDLLIVDYLQLVAGSAAENRTQQVTEITRALKALAKELDVPVLALSQLSRAVESRADKRPQLADLRESGSIEQDADIVMFVYREEYYLARGSEQDKLKALDVTGHAEVLIAKHRNGPVGTARLHFDHKLMRFEDRSGEIGG